MPAPTGIAAQLSNARFVLERSLGGNLRAIHLFGSSAEGGLGPYSDIDLLVTVDCPLAEPVRRSLMNGLLSVSAWPGASEDMRALEVTVIVLDEVVPWRFPPVRELQFGEWLREDLERGSIPPPVPDHDLAIMLAKARQRSLCLAGVPAPELFDDIPKKDLACAFRAAVAQWTQEDDWKGDERNVVLALARIWFSISTGGIASKDAAAGWALERLPPELRPVLASARAIHLGKSQEDMGGRGEEIAALVHHLKPLIMEGCSQAIGSAAGFPAA